MSLGDEDDAGDETSAALALATRLRDEQAGLYVFARDHTEGTEDPASAYATLPLDEIVRLNLDPFTLGPGDAFAG